MPQKPVLNYNSPHHTNIGCEPKRVFHGRVPYNVLDLKMSIRPQITPTPSSQIAEDVLKQPEIFFQDVRINTMQAYIKYKASYDKKANASKLKKQHYVFVLETKTDHQGSKLPFTNFRGTGLDIVENASANNN